GPPDLPSRRINALRDRYLTRRYLEVPVGAMLGVLELPLWVVPCGTPETGAVVMPRFVAPLRTPGVTASLLPAAGFAPGLDGLASEPLPRRSALVSPPAPPAPPPAPPP